MTRDGGKGDKQDLRMSMEDVLAKQPDFAKVKSMLDTSITERGHLILMVPKYHCECNEIELLWSASESYTRRF